jgi:hypothetical protein
MSQKKQIPTDGAVRRVSWRPDEWATATGFSTAWAYKLLDQGKIKAKKVGRATVITTAPDEYIGNLPDYVSQRGTGATFGREASASTIENTPVVEGRGVRFGDPR